MSKEAAFRRIGTGLLRRAYSTLLPCILCHLRLRGYGKGTRRMDGRGRWLSSVALAAVVAGAALHADSTSARAATADTAASNDLDALVLGRAGSPAVGAMRDVAALDTVRRANVGRLRPHRYDMLVVDGDQLTSDELSNRAALQRFVGANKWISAFDVGASDHEALETYTGFDLAAGVRSDHSEAFVFRVSMAEGTPTVEMIDSGPYSQPGTARVGERRESNLKAFHVRRVARVVDTRVDTESAPAAQSDVGASASKLEERGCTGLNPAPDPELQHVSFCYTDVGERPTPKGYWTEKNNPYWSLWIAREHAPGQQTANWTMNHRFDLFLNNPPCTRMTGKPKDWCHFQAVYYELDGFFNPKISGQDEKKGEMKNENFFRMDRREDMLCIKQLFANECSGHHRFNERAWWTAQAEPNITPLAGNSEKLSLVTSHPESENPGRQITEGESYTIGFTAALSGTAGNPTNVANANFSVGVGASWETHNSTTYEIPAWGVENKSARRELQWLFSARSPCDTRSAPLNPNPCFEAIHDKYDDIKDGYQPLMPPDRSTGQLRVRTSGGWRTNGVLPESNGKLQFRVSTPVRLADTYCTYGASSYRWCGTGYGIGDPGARRYREEATGPRYCVPSGRTEVCNPYTDVQIDTSLVNPVPIKALRLGTMKDGKFEQFKPGLNIANGTKNEKVTGEVELARVAHMPVNITIFSNSDNANVGPPLIGFSGGSTRRIEIDQGQSKGTFTIATNDNKLRQPGEHTTATITAFDAEGQQAELRIERR